jgi:hypothetical protein
MKLRRIVTKTAIETADMTFLSNKKYNIEEIRRHRKM